MGDLNWTDDQWRKVKDAVTEAFGKASVASAFLPLYGPLSGGTETVRNERLLETDSHEDPLTLDGDHDAANLKLINLTVKVKLSSEQVADESLSNALLAFRRAGNILAQEQDRIVFEGHRRGDQDSEFIANTVGPQKGVADPDARLRFKQLVVDPSAEGVAAGVNATGVAVVSAVVSTIRRLEDNSHTLPFACVLGNDLFEAVQQPSFAFVLPSDRIAPLLKGPLLRSGKMNATTGVVVSLGTNAVDIVIGTPPTAQFLQRTEDARFLFRVYTRFALRIRDKEKPPFDGFTIPSQESADKQVGVREARIESAQKTEAAEKRLKSALEQVAYAASELAAANEAVTAKAREELQEELGARQAALKELEDKTAALEEAKKQVDEAKHADEVMPVDEVKLVEEGKQAKKAKRVNKARKK